VSKNARSVPKNLPHAFEKVGKGGKKSSVSVPWQYCDRCGLVLLRNEASNKAAKAPCSGEWPVKAVVYLPFKKE